MAVPPQSRRAALSVTHTVNIPPEIGAWRYFNLPSAVLTGSTTARGYQQQGRLAGLEGYAAERRACR